MACAPPSEAVYVHQSAELLFVEWDGFSKKFQKNLYARMEEAPYGLVPKYDLLLWEDPFSREIVVENGYGNEVARLDPETGFDPLGWAKTSLGVTSAAALTDFQQIIHDSAHTALSLSLTPVVFAAAYDVEPVYESDLEVEAVTAVAVMSTTTSVPEVPTNTSTNTGGGISLTNQPATLTFNLPAGFGERGEIFQSDSLVYPSWSLAADRLAVTNATEFVWTTTPRATSKTVSTSSATWPTIPMAMVFPLSVKPSFIPAETGPRCSISLIPTRMAYTIGSSGRFLDV